MKKNKTERTVDDIVKYDKTNEKYAPFISKILNCIKVGRNKMQNGSGLQELSFKLSEICIKINKKYKFIPRPVQILAILRLADSVFNNNYKGSIGEIKTGEGKSFIVSTLAILLCLYGKKVDIITSNIELASRDQKEQEKNFELFDISSGVLYKEEEREYLKENKSYDMAIEDGYNLEVFKKTIVYSTNSNFEFVYLGSMFASKPLRPYERKYDVVIVDEVDNMFIDQGTSPAQLSEPCDLIHYKDILNIIYYNKDEEIGNIQNNMDLLFNLCAFFKNPGALKYIKDLKNAALCSDKKIKDIDYIVENGKVIIIDRNTGLKKPKSKWSDSIHEMVQIKEGYNPDNHSVTYSSVTQHDFFNKYNKILGVTGTVGTNKDRIDLQQIYGVEIFKCPRHFIKEKKITMSKRPEGLDNIFASLNEDISKENKKGRPVLVIMDNIRNVDDYVSQSSFKDINTIKGINPDDDEKSRKEAGKKGQITIATSAAGRGVDIKLSEIVLKNGGLHVIIPFLMPNQRALEQAAGRCGRQGQPGSVNIYYSSDDYYLMSKAFDKKHHNLWILQNQLVEYLHQNNEFLFNGGEDKRIPNMQIPCCSKIPDVLKICIFQITNSKFFYKVQENSEIIISYLMDMVKISWGLFYNELTKDEKCEDIYYCKKKLTDYISYLNEYIPSNVKEFKHEIKYLKDKLFPTKISNKGKALIIGGITIALIGASVFFFPKALPSLLFGAYEIKDDVLNALNNNEDINWKKILVKFGRGAVNGIALKLGPKAGFTANFISSPIFDYAEAKIDGKDYNFFEELKKQGVNALSEKASQSIIQKYGYFGKDIINKLSSKSAKINNDFLRNLVEKVGNNPKLKEAINNTANNFNKNLTSSLLSKRISKDIFLTEDSINNILNHSTKDFLLEPSDYEKELFEDLDDSVKKASKKTSNQLILNIAKKIEENRYRTSNREEIIKSIINLKKK